MASKAFEGLKPELVWNYFSDICEIPRESGNEKAVGDYVERVALSHGCEVLRDEPGNVIVKVPASKGKEDAPVIVIQGHLDMVCEKNKSSDHNFDTDPIVPLREGEWITADGTTLGADNGIAVAAGLALLDDEEAVHGPLELFFTVDEESGMTGVKEMNPSVLQGRTMLNLDSEEDGIFYIGCAGGLDSKVTLKVSREDIPSGFVATNIIVNGLKGGHSGCDIHLGRGNAIKLLARAVIAGTDAVGEDNVRICCFDGGSKRNAIPRESEATVFVKDDLLGSFVKAVEEFNAVAKLEYTIQEPELSIVARDGGCGCQKAMKKEDGHKLIQFVSVAPNGALQYSAAVHGLVETSTNLGVVTTDKDEVTIVLLTRSSLDASVENVARSISFLGELVGATVNQEAGYPGWNPSLSSKVLGVCKDVYREKHGKEPEIKAIHAGLECAIIGGRIPDMDMISYGPSVEFPHSPDEKIKINTVANFYNFTKDLLKELCK